MLTLSDYQLPVIASFLLAIAMVSYWISLSTLKSLFIVQTSKVLIVISNILFTFTLLLRWIKEGYFPLSNLYESLIFLSWGISVIHIFIEQ